MQKKFAFIKKKMFKKRSVQKKKKLKTASWHHDKWHDRIHPVHSGGNEAWSARGSPRQQRVYAKSLSPRGVNMTQDEGQFINTRRTGAPQETMPSVEAGMKNDSWPLYSAYRILLSSIKTSQGSNCTIYIYIYTQSIIPSSPCGSRGGGRTAAAVAANRGAPTTEPRLRL